MNKRLLPFAVFFGALAVLLVGTRRDLTHPHMRLFLEMSQSPAYKTQTPNPVLPAGRTQQEPPRGTVARGSSRTEYGPSLEERARAARELKNPVPPSLAAQEEGKRLFLQNCSHCHGEKGRGDGAVTKAYPRFSFSVAGKSTLDLPDGEVFHILTYGRNNMPAHALQLEPEQRWKIVHYLRDLERAEIARLGPQPEFPEDPRRLNLVSAEYGKELFAANCASCHGAEGRAPVPGVPTLNMPSTLAVADDDYYFSIIAHGRTGTQMPAWEKSLTRTQMLSVVRYLRLWAKPGADRGVVLALAADPVRGESIFRGRCAPCHGRRGEGGVGNTLNSPSFLSIASPQFFRDMVIGGRKHTAMPAAYDMSTEEVANLVAYLRSWSKPRHSFAEVSALLPTASVADGAKLYSGRCASCHGANGQGSIGSRLNSESFLRMADDRFLFQAISEGRPGTAMPGWYQLSSRDMAEIIAFVKSWRKGPAVVLAGTRHRGEAEFGQLIFNKACISCHGPEGRGGTGGQIGNPQFLASVSDEFLYQTIAHGKSGSGMRGFLEGKAVGALMSLTPGDIDHVISYLRTLPTKPRIDLLDREFPGASADVGNEIFHGKGGCAKCHGQDGEGSSGPSLNSPGFLKAASNGYLAATIILGRDGTEMRSFTRGGNVKLDPGDVTDLVAYIRSWERNPPKAVRVVDRTESSVAMGKSMFNRYCIGCHGEEGRGTAQGSVKGYAPSLNTKEFLKAADDSFLMATIALGRPNTGMRPFGAGAGGVADLSAADIRKIVAYIRSWEEKR